MKTEEWCPADSVKIKREDCVLKCEDPKVNYGWLDPQILLYITLKKIVALLQFNVNDLLLLLGYT